METSRNPYSEPTSLGDSDRPNYRVSRLVFRAGLFAFGLSMIFSCFHLEGDVQQWLPADEAAGALLLMIGWIGLFEGEYAWLANPLWLGAIVALVIYDDTAVAAGVHQSGRLWTSLSCSTAALVAALTFSFQTHTHCGRGGGGLDKIGGLEPGYYLWLLSILAVMTSAAHSRKAKQELGDGITIACTGVAAGAGF